MKPLATSIFAMALSIASAMGTNQACAGPLLDRIKERLATRAEARAPDVAERALEDPYDADKSAASAAVGRKVLRDVPYGSDPKQRMDVYLPSVQGSGLAPVIFMVHGGGWRMGDKRMGRVVDNKTARWLPKGFVFVSVNNRLLPEADPLDQVRDVARALAVAQGQATAWGADAQQFILMGHSAGAHLVALLAASPHLGPEAGAKPWLGTVALDSAAMDVSAIMEHKHYRLYDPAFGTDRDFWRAASPLQQLQSDAKPFLAVCSSRREESCSQARAFAQRGASLGVRIQTLPQDLSHAEINDTLGLSGNYTQAVESFLASLSGQVASRLAKP